MNEFSLIERFFANPAAHEPRRPGCGWVSATTRRCLPRKRLGDGDHLRHALVEGRHFLAGTDPEALGWKALAVNLSDLAAMGAVPTGFLLALTLPEADEPWLPRPSARGLLPAPVGRRPPRRRDTNGGPRALTITALGRVPAGEAILRSGARAGDDLWVSGQPGRAALGLAVRLGALPSTLPGARKRIDALDRPEPRLALGCRLRGLAHAMLDVSDGLLGYLAPPPQALGTALPHRRDRGGQTALDFLVAGGAPLERVRAALLTGGDDYELLFTAAPESRQRLAQLAGELNLPLSRIGRLVPATTHPIVLIEPDGSAYPARSFGL